MIRNINEINTRSNINYYLNISFKKRNHLMIVEFETLVFKLKEKIFNYFKLEPNRYDLYYKNIKINSSDNWSILYYSKKK